MMGSELGFIKKMRFKQRLETGARVSPVATWRAGGRMFQAEGIARIKVWSRNVGGCLRAVREPGAE